MPPPREQPRRPPPAPAASFPPRRLPAPRTEAVAARCEPAAGSAWDPAAPASPARDPGTDGSHNCSASTDRTDFVWRLIQRWHIDSRRAFKEERLLSKVVNPTLLGEVHAKKQVLAVFHVALSCTDPEMRPRMRAVADSLDRINNC